MGELIKPYEGKVPSILLFGPPGAGKGMLGTFLASSGTQFHLSSGKIFRSLPANSPAGKLYYAYAKKGALLPDEATIEIWKYYVQGLIATNAYYPETQDLLLDGIPRTLEQAQLIEEFVHVRHIIVLEVACVEKLQTRLQEQAHAEGNFAALDPANLKAQMERYKKEMEKIYAHYPTHLVSRVNGDQRPLEVLRDVLVRLSHLLSRGPV